jgi:predicted transcriptional regulator
MRIGAVKKHRFPLEVLFPKVRAQVFELLFGATSREHYVRELALRSHLTLHTIQDELRKLSALGLVSSRSNGFHRYYQANRSHALYPAIRQIVTLSSQSPRAHVAALRRAPGKRSSKQNRRPRRAHLKLPYGPINWGVLQKKS